MTIGDPRPKRRIADPLAGIGKVRQEGACRACGRKGLQHLSRAHLVSKGQRGDDVDVNIVPLCGDGVRGCHGALHDHGKVTAPSHFAGADWLLVAHNLRVKLLPAERQYILSKKGEDWLSRTYPIWT